MKKKLCIILWLVFLTSCATVKSSTYKETVAQWTSYKDVANWMEKNFRYDMARSRMVRGWQARTPEQTFEMRSGVCQDAAAFARDALNRINPDYDARIIYVKNKLGLPHHWVNAFAMDGKLYIIDYGASNRWSAMMGVHGPYDSLKEYEGFLSSLRIQGFAVEYVECRR